MSAFERTSPAPVTVAQNEHTLGSLTSEPRGELAAEGLEEVEAFCRACLRRERPTENLQARWDSFFQTNFPFIRWLVVASGVKPGDLEDCVQEVWIDVVCRLADGHFDPQRGRFGCWLFTVVRNRAIDFVRAVNRSPKVECADMTFLPSHELDPAASFECQRQRMLVRAALERLPLRTSPTTFQTLYQSSIEEKDTDQVARDLGLTPEQVRNRRRRATQRLRDLLRRSSQSEFTDAG